MGERPSWNDGKRDLWAKIAKSLYDFAFSSLPTSAQAGTNIAAWGDSLTQDGGLSYPSYLASITGFNVFNGGISGETSTQIRTRMVADTAKSGWMTIIWAGRNNYFDPSTVKNDIAAMVASLGHNRYVVMSIINGDNAGERRNEPIWASIIQLNADLRAIYGIHYFDVRSYLVSLYNPSIPQDVIDHTNDVPPSSLRFDTLHLNSTGYQNVAGAINNSYLNILKGVTGIVLPNPNWNDSAIDLIRKTAYSTASIT